MLRLRSRLCNCNKRNQNLVERTSAIVRTIYIEIETGCTVYAVVSVVACLSIRKLSLKCEKSARENDKSLSIAIAKSIFRNDLSFAAAELCVVLTATASAAANHTKYNLTLIPFININLPHDLELCVLCVCLCRDTHSFEVVPALEYRITESEMFILYSSAVSVPPAATANRFAFDSMQLALHRDGDHVE